ncbi:UNVERIFIED_CONTAM: Serine/threonine-protein phosphatase 6 regulatory subunit [Sesamum radiatum]|uniref:Serine/threonine-protein phosphatase 6 regulatory subunit n=1 Tax=Sesamum radiatum TaxID=300843 RepID=A0AAW2K1X2_SESRA
MIVHCDLRFLEYSGIWEWCKHGSKVLDSREREFVCFEHLVFPGAVSKSLFLLHKVDTILDKEHFTLEELLDEDEIIQEVKALNGRLISFLQEKSQVNQLVQYIVEEAPEDAKKPRIFKFPFVACEIFTCEVDIILKALVEEDEAHQDIINKLVDLIGITSIMEVLIRLIGVDEHIYANYGDSMQWFEDMNVLEMIVDKFSSSDCPEVHANAAETLCTISRYAPQGLASKISSPSFIGRLFRHAFEDFRPKSVLVNLLSVCISLLDPKRLTSGVYYMYNRQMSQGAGITANPETVEGMLESLGILTIISYIIMWKMLCTLAWGARTLSLLNIFFVSVISLGRFLKLTRNSLWLLMQARRPTTLLDRMRDSDDDEYQDRDYDVAALANNLSQAFQYGICTNDVIDEGHGSAERDDEVCIFTASRLFNHGFLVILTWLLMVMASEWPSKVTTMDVYFDDASAEVVISSLRLGHEQESGSLFTNSDWFAFEDQRIDSSIASPSPKGHVGADGGADDVIFEKDKDLVDSTIFNPLELNPTLDGNNVTSKLSEDMRETTIIGLNKPPEWVEWRESSDSIELPPPLSSPETSNTVQCPSIPNGEPMELGVQLDDVELDKAESLANVHCKTDGGGSPDLNNVDSSPKTIQSAQVGDLNRRILEVDSHVIEDSSGSAKCENKN